jgi:flagellar basal-body rod modification protein FlgD
MSPTVPAGIMPDVTTKTGATRMATSSGNSAASATDPSSVNMDEFLQLLVAEIQNQDPTNPMDGTAFLTQLAQFQQVEQGLTLNQDVSSILTDANTLAGAS